MLARLERADAAVLLVQGDEIAAAEAKEAAEAIEAKLALAADQFANDILTGEQLARISAKMLAIAPATTCGDTREHDGDICLHVDTQLHRCPLEFFAIPAPTP